MKTVDFSETIAACDLKVGRCRQLIEFMKLCEYRRSRSFLYHIFSRFCMFCAYKAKISGERLQDHWSSGFRITSKLSITGLEKMTSHVKRKLAFYLIGERLVYPCSVFPRRSQCSNIFFETTCPIKAKFYLELLWVGGTSLFPASGSHDQAGHHAHI